MTERPLNYVLRPRASPEEWLMSLYMLHTDIVTDLIQAKSPVLDRRIVATAPQELCISAITRGELLCALPQETLRRKGRKSEQEAAARKATGGGEAESLRKSIHAILASLTPREAKELRMRFGIDMSVPHTLEEVDKQFEATRERIRSSEQALDRFLIDVPRHPWDEEAATRELISSREQADPLSGLLDQFLTRVACLPWDAEAATHFARIAVDLHLSGSAMGSLDTMIAGHAVAVGAVLVSNSKRQFSRVTGLKIENWTRGC
jgi:predicted nucleic acid-binding protein